MEMIVINLTAKILQVMKIISSERIAFQSDSYVIIASEVQITKFHSFFGKSLQRSKKRGRISHWKGAVRDLTREKI